MKDFLSDVNGGLRQLVQYMNFRYQIELKYVDMESYFRQMCNAITVMYSQRETNAAVRSPLVRTKSEDSGGSPKSRRHHHMLRGTADAADIHVCVLCIKALMNNAVSTI